MATIKGTSKKNTLPGTEFSDTILGLGNDDRLFGGDGVDTLKGGTGNDKLFGGNGNDRLFGDAGNDALNGGAGRDTMRGGQGDDVYIVDSGGDRVIEKAGQGTDTVRSSLEQTKLGANVENLVLTGHAGNRGTVNGSGNELDNVITGNSAINILFGAGGDDTLYGGAGRDALIGGLGDYKLSGGAGADSLDGGEGFNFASYQTSSQGVTVNVSVFNNPLTTNVGGSKGIGGDAQGDVLFRVEGLIGSNFNDDLAGDSAGPSGNGNQGTFLIGGGGSDILHGGNLDDFLIDGAADNVFFNTGGIPDPFFNVFGSGSDQIFGGGGSDFIDGGSGADVLDGGAGSDTIVGGTGADILIGGADSVVSQDFDKFIYTSAADSGVGAGNRDRILDFTQLRDKIDLSFIDASTDPQFRGDSFFFGGQQPAGHIASFALSVPNPTPEVSFFFEGSNTIVQAYISDNQGHAINRFEIELTGHIVLTANDFVL